MAALDWFFIKIGTKYPFRAKFKEGRWVIDIPFEENLVLPGQVVLIQEVNEKFLPSDLKLKPLSKQVHKLLDYDGTSIEHHMVSRRYKSRIYGYAGFVNNQLIVVPPVLYNEFRTEAYLIYAKNQADKYPPIDDIIELIRFMGFFPSETIKDLSDNIEKIISGDMRNLPICRGKEPEEGWYEYIKADVHVNKRAGSIKEDGSIDFRDRDSIREIMDGQVIGQWIAEKQPIQGFDVYHEALEAAMVKKGPKPGENIVRDEKDENLAVSKVNGYLNEGLIEISVAETLVINGDIDFETGHIDFLGNVKIMGTVKRGFTVNSGGDINVQKIVEGGTLKARKNIYIYGGVIGKGDSVIECDENLMANYIQNATVTVKGDIIVEDFIYHSTVISNGSITALSKSGSIIGGVVTAKKKIEILTAGNKSEVPTEITVGIDQDFQIQVDALEEELKVIRDTKENLVKQATAVFSPLLFRNPKAYLINLEGEKKQNAIKIMAHVAKYAKEESIKKDQLDELRDLGPVFEFDPEIIIVDKRFAKVIINIEGRRRKKKS